MWQPERWGDVDWAEAARRLQQDAGFRDALTARVAGAPHEAVFWECTPSSSSERHRPFRCVVIDAPALARVRPDPDPFPVELRDAGATATFPNLSGDAWLVVPSRRAEPERYTHLAAFVRGAPRDQVHALWQAVGEAVERWWAERRDPVWVSTSGLGVSWLHVRLDERPKYYHHAPYRAF